MNKRNIKKKVSFPAKIIISIFIILFAVFLIKYSKDVSVAITVSIESCLKIVVPSLFAFMVISNLLIKSNIYVLLSKPFYLISRYLFRIPPELFSIFLLSNIGGYPIGAKLLAELIDENKIDKSTAENMMCYCYCNSPSFFAGAVGVVVFNDYFVGLIAYFSIVIANFIIAILLGIKNKIPEKSKVRLNIKLNPNILIDSITSAAKVLFTICAMLIFFASVIAILSSSGILNILSNNLMQILHSDYFIAESSLMSFFEISKISTMSKNSYNYLPLMTCIAAFGGICVITQIIGITAGKINLKKFAVSHAFHIAISGIMCYYLIKLFTINLSINTIYYQKIIYSKNISIIPSICLIFMVIILLYSKKYRFFKEGVL